MHTIKILKVGLPLATAASASVATASLVSTRREDIKLSNKNEDRILEDFEKPSEIFEEQIINYPKDPEKKESKEEDVDNTKKLEEEVNKELDKLKRKEAVQKLLENPEELLKHLSLDPNAQQREAIIKQIQTRANELMQKSEILEREAPDTETRMEGGQEIQGESDSVQAMPSGPEVAQEVETRMKEIQQTLENKVQGLQQASDGAEEVQDTRGDTSASEDIQEPAIREETDSSIKIPNLASEEEQTLSSVAVPNADVKEKNQEVERTDEGELQMQNEDLSLQEGEKESMDSKVSSGDKEGVLSEGGEESELNKREQLETLEGLSEKLNDALSQLSFKFNL